MDKAITDIIDKAKKYKACERVTEINSFSSALKMLYSPQGREFAINTGFPTIEILRTNAESIVGGGENFFLDKGEIELCNCDCIIAGGTIADISLKGTEKLFHIIVMHGAKATVIAENYAVVTITNINSCITIINDGTSVINIEKKGDKTP